MKYKIMATEVAIPSKGIRGTEDLKKAVWRLAEKGEKKPFGAILDTESEEEMDGAWNGLKMAKPRLCGEFIIITMYAYEVGSETRIMDIDCEISGGDGR